MAVSTPPPIAPVAPGVFRFRDTCNVYVLQAGREAVLVDFGSGAVLDHLGGLGVDRVTDVLVTHHHRDQVQGLALAAAAGARIWAPPVEVELIADVSSHWLRRQVDNDYDLRQDRFSLLESVPVEGTVAEYRTRRYGGVDVFTLPTPGHTLGSVTYIVDVEGRRLAFCGDLVYGDGKLWSLAATQWTYSGVEGLASTIVSTTILEEHEPALLLPSHGEPVEDAPRALGRVRERVSALIAMRGGPQRELDRWRREPWVWVTPHLLRNRTSFANSYALVSESGAALLVDWGYDHCTGTALGADRSARRPLVASIGALREHHGVDRVEAAIVTHFHDDHVAGLNLLRDVEGVEVWAPENVAPVLENPHLYDLPCLWYDPIPVDRVLPLGEPFAWQEYELTPYELPGHTLHAAAYLFEVDGKRVLATGDQQASDPQDRPAVLNYQYRNRFSIDDYVRSGDLYLSLRPDIVISGHWFPFDVTDEWLERLRADGGRLAELHRDLLPLADVDFGAEGFGARITPYRSAVAAGAELELEVTVRNPFGRAETAVVALAVPAGWEAPEPQEIPLEPGGSAAARFRLRAGGAERRARVAADLTVGGTRFGQQAEALVDVRGAGSPER